jgi:hypothetical protein
MQEGLSKQQLEVGILYFGELGMPYCCWTRESCREVRGIHKRY